MAGGVGRYFHERVVPIAEHFKVQLACHLDDPPAPSLKGVARWDYPVFEGCKRFGEMVESPYNGLNFCCGTAAEGLEDPKAEVRGLRLARPGPVGPGCAA